MIRSAAAANARARRLVGADPLTARFGHLDEHQTSAEVSTGLEHVLDDPELLFESLGVVQAVDADDQPRAGRQVQLTIDRPPAQVGRRCRRENRIGPVDPDRECADRGGGAGVRHVPPCPVDARVAEQRRALQEIVAVVGGLHAQEVAPEQPAHQIRSVGAAVEDPCGGPGDMPEGGDRARRQAHAQHRRRECEVVVLDQDNRRPGIGFMHGSFDESRVRVPIHPGIDVPEHGPDPHGMAQRPEPFVGEAVVVAAPDILRQTDVAEVEGRVTVRDPDCSTVDNRVRIPGGVRNPDA